MIRETLCLGAVMFMVGAVDYSASWRDVYSTDNGHGVMDDHVFPAVNARYVRLWTPGEKAFSIREMEVFRMVAK